MSPRFLPGTTLAGCFGVIGEARCEPAGDVKRDHHTLVPVLNKVCNGDEEAMKRIGTAKGVPVPTRLGAGLRGAQPPRRHPRTRTGGARNSDVQVEPSLIRLQEAMTMPPS